MNRAGLDMIEAESLDQVKGLCVYQLVSEEYREAFRTLTQEVFKGESRKLEFRMIGLKGRPLWLYTHAVPLRDEKGEIVLALATTIDITERKLAEERLHESDERYRLLTETAPNAITVADTLGHITMVNKGALAVYGHSDAVEVLGRNIMEWVSPEEQEKASAAFARVLGGGNVTDLELRLMKGNGDLFWASVNASLAHEHDGRPSFVIIVTTDVTGRRQAEEALHQSEERLRLAMMGANDGLWDWNLQTDEVYYSPRWMAMLGYGAEELEHHLDTWKRLVHPENRERTLVAVSDFLEGRADKYEVEFRMQHKDGHYLSILSRAFLAHNARGRVSRLVGTHVDITQRKEAEEKLRQSEAFIRNILDTVDEGFIVIDRDFRILTANKAYCSQVGEPCDSVIGRHCFEVSHKSPRPCNEEGEECAVLHVFEIGEPQTALHKHQDAKGSILYIETKAFPIKDSTGAVISVIETVNNMTEKHLLEEEQLKTQKLEAIGLLAGGIAHDFNNLLQGVFGYISMAKMTLDQKERSLSMLEQAEKALHMSVSLTSQLLTFSKGGKPIKKKMLLRPMIENSVKFALSGSRVDYSIETDQALRMVEADEGQIGQVIQNIVLNADQAMPLGGRIAITAKNVRAPQEGLPALPAKGNFVEISVKDNGGGIPERYLSRLFDPYFTTKERGSGLGLATSYSIIRNHGGLINVKSQLGKGSTFFVYLPAVEAEEARVVTIPAKPEIVRKGRILVMDDEEVVRTIAGIMMEELGHKAEFAEDGEEAIAKYCKALSLGKRFDLVILDLTVRGGLGGEETLQELLALDPEVKAVVSSGYSDSSTISEYESRGFSACLAKPYELQALRDVLNVLLK